MPENIPRLKKINANLKCLLFNNNRILLTTRATTTTTAILVDFALQLLLSSQICFQSLGRLRILQSVWHLQKHYALWM